jgi:hypothetical protein
MVIDIHFDWKDEYYQYPDKIEGWCIARRDFKIYNIYSLIECDEMSASVSCHIIREHPITGVSEIIYFTKQEETGMLNFLAKWIGKTIDDNKKILERRV